MQTSIIVENSDQPTFVAVSVEYFGLKSIERQHDINRKLENWMREKLRHLYGYGLVSYYPSRKRSGQRLLLEYNLVWKKGETNANRPCVNRAYFEYHEFRNKDVERALAARKRRDNPAANVARPFGAGLQQADSFGNAKVVLPLRAHRLG